MRAGIAETGSVMITSGPDNRTTLAFLPEAHLVVLPARRIHGTYEDAWAHLRAKRGPGRMPARCLGSRCRVASPLPGTGRCWAGATRRRC